jgi:hypothetical protein
MHNLYVERRRGSTYVVVPLGPMLQQPGRLTFAHVRSVTAVRSTVTAEPLVRRGRSLRVDTIGRVRSFGGMHPEDSSHFVCSK